MKNCRIHDIVHALAIRKAEEDNFLMVFPGSRADSTSGICTSARRAAFHGLDGRGGVVRDLGQICLNLRSLMLFGESEHLHDFSEFEMVRLRVVLKSGYKSTSFYHEFDDWAWIQPKKLTVLRYLELRSLYIHIDRTVNFLSHVAHHLKNIQSFEIDLAPSYKYLFDDSGACCACLRPHQGRININVPPGRRIIELPNSLWENKLLRHVIFPPQTEWLSGRLLGWMGPPRWAKLENLVTLKGAIVRGKWSVKLARFSNIRKLSITLLEDKNSDWEEMINSLVQLEHLTSLHVYECKRQFSQRKNYIDFTPAFKNFKQLRSLSLPIHGLSHSNIETIAERIVDKSGLFPPSLVKLRLGDIYGRTDEYIEVEQIQVKLPNLLVLLSSKWRWAY